MLKHLHIRDFAVIEEIEIQFEQGMTVFTGETGAGKSIIVDALGLVLGDRADSSVIRGKCNSAEITAIFDLDENQSIRDILDEQEISYEDELMFRRVINLDGRSRAYLNGSPVPVQLMRDLGEELVDIHGQHAHQSLLKRDVQRKMLDNFGQHDVCIGQVRQHYETWHNSTSELARLSGKDDNRDAQLALLQYQVQELEALNPDTEEIAALEEEHSRLTNASRLLDSGRQALEALSEQEHSISSRINHVRNDLQGLLRFDQSLSSITDLLDNANIQVNEAISEISHYIDNLELDPVRLREVEDRITTMHDIARKHKIKPEELSTHLETLRLELKKLEDSEERFIELEKIREQALKQYLQAAEDLHKQRVNAAKKLEKAIEDKLKQLGMPGGRFEINIQAINKETPSRDGMDRIEYQVAINPGQAMLPLHKVASGGELSRISLAIQVIGSKDKGLPVLIFDEVDSGIGGGVAEIVGNLLHSLAGNRQVFCVTHLPQVASLGDHHLLVNKSTHAETTLTQIIHLNKDDRVEEIARMLGGLKITDQTRAHAREMLAGNR